ncbi:MAG: sensor histidine kinase, partial [Bacteroidota bacterium]
WMSERIYKNARRLLRLLENYLIYAQLELKQHDLLASAAVKETHDADNVVQATAEVRAEEFGRLGDLQCELSSGTVAMPPVYFKKIVEELVDNALKFSKVGSPVFVVVAKSDEGFVVSVTDRGRGMSVQQIKEIGAFVQFERNIYEQQGMGLGLILAKKLALLHGGELNVQSEIGTGTTVRVKLPQA